MKNKINKLEINKRYHYKDIIEILELKYKTSRYRKYQIEEIKRYCDLTRKGNAYVVNKIYATPLEKINPYKVYMHRNKTNNKVYVGITLQPVNERWRNGTNYYGNEYFSRAIKKYGWDGFEHIILFDNLTKEEAENKEIELINKYNSTNRNYGYNIEKGGNTSGKHSEETLRKMSESQKGGLNHTAKRVICLNTKEIFDCIADCEKIYGHNVGYCCRKKSNYTLNKNKERMYFMFMDEYEQLDKHEKEEIDFEISI